MCECLHAVCVCVCVCVRKTLRFALRLSEGICRVTLYSVCRSSSSEMKQASCTRRFALTICSLNRRRLLTNTASLEEEGAGKKGRRRRGGNGTRWCLVFIYIQMKIKHSN